MMSCVGRGIVLRQLDRLFGEGTLAGLGDGQLLERYLTRRDEDAFEVLVDLHGPMVLGLCRRMLRDPRDIEDAFQATFLVLARKAPAIRDRNLLSSWLYGVAFRVARRARTQMLRRRDRESTVGELECAARPETAETPEFDPMLDQELSRLPEKYRVPLVLCYLRGKTHDQAAEELRCPVGTVRSRLARGRDLLRQRLTRRGFTPGAMAALLGGDPGFPARLLVATVPPPLAAATVRAALAFGSSPVLKAGASSLALAQGVLTTMKFTPIKWIGLTVLSAGSVVAMGYASTARQDPAASPKAVAIEVPAQGQGGAESPAAATTTEARLKALEDKIDRLMNRLGAPASAAARAVEIAPPATTTEPPMKPKDEPASGDPLVRSEKQPAMTAGPIRELEAELALALKLYDRANQMFRRGAISVEDFDRACGNALVIVARLEGIEDDVQHELARLELELLRKQAELQRAEAFEKAAGFPVARNARLNARKKDMVSEEDVGKAEAELAVATAGVGIARTEVSEVKLRIRHLRERQERAKRAVAKAERLKSDEPQRSPAASADPVKP
jgi:RNA polymerase sigma factor (sigma-70 family)